MTHRENALPEYDEIHIDFSEDALVERVCIVLTEKVSDTLSSFLTLNCSKRDKIITEPREEL